MKQDHIVDTNKMVTAVEWLIEQLENVEYNPLEKGGYDTAKKRIIEQAKQMEREQIINAIDSQYSYDKWLKELPTLGEQYYNETYK
jgi:hypothetical protein